MYLNMISSLQFELEIERQSQNEYVLCEDQKYMERLPEKKSIVCQNYTRMRVKTFF